MTRLSERIAGLKSSPVREMLEVSQRPDVISFAGGLPAPETFADLDLAGVPRELLQYGPSEGEPELRARIGEELRGLGLDAPAERVLILSGSRQGIDLAAKLVVDRGTAVAVESPAYLAALQVFGLFGATLGSLGWDEGAAPAMAYVVPTFQNPTGRCWSAAERSALAAACDRDDVILFEDDPYRDLAYDPCERRPVASWLGRAPWIYQGSFSKTLAPGYRVGWIAAGRHIDRVLERKYAHTLCGPALPQMALADFLGSGGYDGHLRRVRSIYHHNIAQMSRAIEAAFPAGTRVTRPAGGFVLWLELPEAVDTRALFDAALAEGICFAPGDVFSASGRYRNCLRLSCGHPWNARIETGVARLGALASAAAS